MSQMTTPRVCLAPMAGITDWPLRVLCYRMGADYTCSEMVSAMGYMCAKPNNPAYQLLLATHPEETNTACQIFGKDPVVMAEATARITELSRFTSIDINMGCPARKITSGGEGSALHRTPDIAYRVMEAVKKSTHLPVTLKTRLGYDQESMNALPLAKMAESLGFSWVCFHGRTREQQYSGVADYEAIAELKAQLSLPVIANGDVFQGVDAKRILVETNCDGLMIGRGSMGNPWLFREAKEALEGRDISPVTKQERLQTALLHAQWMVSYKGERFGIVEMRKHLSHYVAGLRGATALRREMNTMTDLESLTKQLHQAFDE